VTFALWINAISFAAFAFATEGWMMFAVLFVFALSGLAQPALQAILAKQVPANEQGELQGSLMALGSVATILAPAVYTFLFVTFTKDDAPIYFPGAAYLGASVISIACILLWLKDKGRFSAQQSHS
jgi:DHA1 family tetracycline resistance protein-like MFS transporter